MSYIGKNKEAWEEAFDNRINGWGDAVVESLQASFAYYIQPALQAGLDQLNLAGKHVAQFCCSNGRGLLFISRHYGTAGTDFDIVENLIAQGKTHAKQLHVPCSFSAMSILNVGSEYRQRFDMILSTIGATIWFQDVNAFFRVVFDCLGPGGIMLIRNLHPLMNILPLPGEGCYCDDVVRLLEHRYFTAGPWIENNGMRYISGDYTSKTFTNFSHSVSELVNSIVQSGMSVRLPNGYDYNIGLPDVYDAVDLPLSMPLVTEKV